MDEQNDKQKANLVLGLHQHKHAHFFSPFPSANELAKLKALDQRFLDIAVNNFEKESAHRRQMDIYNVILGFFTLLIGFGTIIALAVLSIVFKRIDVSISSM